MKFLAEEHKSIVELFDECKISPSDYSFRKKRGQLFIELNNRAQAFCFFRKHESKLNDQLQFEDKLTYYVGTEKEIVLNSWEDVLVHIRKWIHT